MGETTYEIVNSYSGIRRFIKMSERIREIHVILEYHFFETFYPESQPASLSMMAYVIANRIYLVWARSAAETNLEIKRLLSELEAGKRFLNAMNFNHIEIPVSILPENKN